MTFITTDTGCMVCTSHKHNPDGYLRKAWGATCKGTRVMEMFHRFIYRAHNNLEEIPKGYEIDHMCRNRACCNPEHLRLLDRTTHLVHTNKYRYAPRLAAARSHWLLTNCTGVRLSEMFGVSFSAGSKWIRDWKQEAIAA